MADFLIAITAVDNQGAAGKLSRSAVEASLTAPRQVTGPIEPFARSSSVPTGARDRWGSNRLAIRRARAVALIDASPSERSNPRL